jgi:hypothetical protein
MTTRRDNDTSTLKKPGDAAEQQTKRHLDEQLDEALKETFPASDSIALTPRRSNAGL